MQNEIGSNFDLNPNIARSGYDSALNIALFGLKGNDSFFLSTGRNAENFVLDTISERNPHIRKVALIPPYTCGTVIVPFLRHNYKVISYPIDGDLNVSIDKFRETLIASEAQVVLVHRYFGFDTLKGFEEIINEFSSKGVVFIDDRTQCIYSDFDPLPADYIIGSLRKWAGLPDGGFAVCKTGFFRYKTDVYDEELERLKLEASFAKYEYLHKNIGEKQYFLTLFKRAEQQLDLETSYYRISPTSVVIQQMLELPVLKKKRRDNYRRLYEGLKRSGALHILTPELTEADVPLYFALCLKRRNELQNHLRLHHIYAPIVWPKPEVCPEICNEAQGIYDSALCLPVDQRYDVDDMDRIIKCIKAYNQYATN